MTFAIVIEYHRTSIIAPVHWIVALQEISKNLVKSNLPLLVRYSSIAQYPEIMFNQIFQYFHLFKQFFNVYPYQRFK